MNEKDFDEDEYLNMWLEPEEIELLKTKEDRVVVKSKPEKSVKKLKHEAKVASKKSEREICHKLDNNGIMARPKSVKETFIHDKFRYLFPTINPNSSKFESLRESYNYIENHIYKERYERNLSDIDSWSLGLAIFDYKRKLIRDRIPINIENLISISNIYHKLLIPILSKRLEFLVKSDISQRFNIDLRNLCYSWNRLKEEFRDIDIFLPDINAKYSPRDGTMDDFISYRHKIGLIEFITLLNKIFDNTYFTNSYILEVLHVFLKFIEPDPAEQLYKSFYGTQFPKYTYKFAVWRNGTMLFPNQVIMDYLMSNNVGFVIPKNETLFETSPADIFRIEKFLSKLVKVKRNSEIIDGYYMFKNLTFKDGYMNKFFRILPSEIRYIIFGYLMYDVVCLKNPIRV